MSKESFTAAVAVFATIVLGLSLGVAVTSSSWEADAIKSGVGEYDTETGKFQWKQPCP